MEKVFYRFDIPVAPVTKKNSGQIVHTKAGRHILLPSAVYQKYEKAVASYIQPYGIETPVNVEAVFYMPTRRRVDLVNLQEALLDVLVKYGCLKDDNSNIVASMDGSLVKYDKDYPRTEVFITSYIGENDEYS